MCDICVNKVQISVGKNKTKQNKTTKKKKTQKFEEVVFF